MAARLQAAGMAKDSMQVLAPPDRPKSGALVAVMPGSDPQLEPLMLLAHIDVVEAKREDWERDPFTLVEEDGFFYARGASDDKAMAAVITDILVRFQGQGFKPRRAVKLALTCGEETPSTFNGVDWLIKTRPGVLKAKFALNEGAGGLLAADGRPHAAGRASVPHHLESDDARLLRFPGWHGVPGSCPRHPGRACEPAGCGGGRSIVDRRPRLERHDANDVHCHPD
jgi:acetylornithine deacetylase/succinyl-diaminopimelate desuccinylase-like protein